MMKSRSGFFIAGLSSISLHGLVIGALLIDWQPTSSKTVVQPQFIQAELIQLTPKKKPVKKPNASPSKDTTAKRRQLEKRRAQEQKQAQLRRESQKKALALKKQQEAEKARMLYNEEQRKAKEAQAEKRLREEQALISVKEDKVSANSYLQFIQSRLSLHWNRPKSARRGMETLIELRLVPTGRIVGVKILESSGDLAFDRSVEQAAFKAAPFSELQSMEPRIFEQYFRNVKIVFNPQDLRL